MFNNGKKKKQEEAAGEEEEEEEGEKKSFFLLLKSWQLMTRKMSTLFIAFDLHCIYINFSNFLKK